MKALVNFLILLAGIVIGALGFAFVFAGEIYDYQDTMDGTHLSDVDAIVCLAGGRGRIAAAGDLWYRYWEKAHREQAAGPLRTPVVYVSGMGPQSNWNVFARQVRRGVLEVIRPENVVLETESRNTEANAQWVVRYSRERGWKRILLLTSPYHMKRSRFMFEVVIRDAGVPLEVQTLSVYQEPFEPGEWRTGLHGIRVTVIEYLKWIYYKTFWRPTKVAA